MLMLLKKMKKTSLLGFTVLAGMILFQSQESAAYSTAGCPYPIPLGLQYPGLAYSTTMGVLAGPSDQVGSDAGFDPCSIFVVGSQVPFVSPPPTQLPKNCIDPTTARASLNSLTVDFEDVLAAGPTASQSSEVFCNGRQFGSTYQCGSGFGETNDPGCITAAAMQRLVAQYRSCVSKYMQNNAQEGAGQKDAVAQWVKDATAYHTACYGDTPNHQSRPHPSSISNPRTAFSVGASHARPAR